MGGCPHCAHHNSLVAPHAYFSVLECLSPREGGMEGRRGARKAGRESARTSSPHVWSVYLSVLLEFCICPREGGNEGGWVG